MPDSTNFFDFLNNENPYAYLRNYENHPFKKDNLKVKLDALQKIQPKFIPCVMDQGVLSNERANTVNFVIRNGVNENIMKGVEVLEKNNIAHDIYTYQIVNQTNVVELSNKAAELQDIGFDMSYVYKHRYNFLGLNYIMDVFKKYIDLEGMEDIVLDICRLKLINKQKILREKVYGAISEKLEDESIMQINIEKDIKEDPIEEAKTLINLKRKFSDL
ncbi:uncharacterized protein VNE69_07187 [Vairimorpha necatrix]|uniref:Uncharacterized protein n=1 Tax=Vairimorpha necatrix TaxID=6039 RepID=A0AAX4JDR7_9MICR